MYAPGGAYPGPDGWNITTMGDLWAQAQTDSSNGNLTGLVAVSNAMNTLANKIDMYTWTSSTYGVLAMTSNVNGFLFYPSLSTAAGLNSGPELFVLLS